MMSESRPSLRDLERLETPDLWREIVHRAPRMEDHAAPLPTWPARRRGWALRVGALAGATAVALIGVLVVGPLGGDGSAEVILAAGRQRFAQSPPFDAELLVRISASVLRAERPEYAGGDTVIRRRVRYAGPDRWRRDTLEESEPSLIDGGPGSFWVWDGASLGVYRADEAVYFVQPTAASFDPLGELSWDRLSDADCATGSRLVAEELVAGRRTDHIACPDRSVWVDTVTGLIMRHTAEGFASEIVSVAHDPTLDPAAFEVEAPAGAGPGLPEPPASTLVVGETPPAWGDQRLDGAPLSLGDLRGHRAAILVWADWCDAACLDHLPAVADLAAAAGDRLRVVTVAVQSEPARVADAIAATGVSVPVVIDGGAIHEAWGIGGVPVLVVLDASGVVQRLAVGRDIPAVLEDLRAVG
jgi:hypothetical protein